ncbi:MAG: hypothetical protein HRT71_06215 [Flavobacteriales bacterium]|nr:hypothetical protein [Flavobacteriales bacterium]
MDLKGLEILLDKFYAGETSINEEESISKYLSENEVPNHLKATQEQFKWNTAAFTYEPSVDLGDRIMDKIQKQSVSPTHSITKYTSIITGVAASVALAIAGYFFYTDKSDSELMDLTQVEMPFVNPPLQNINIPFAKDQLDAKNGKLINYESGSFVYVPPKAFVDENGKIIEGDVEIKFREFNDPIDFLFSGIPMDYQFEGKQYQLESAAMCEILAEKDGKPVFMNPDQKIEVYQKSNTASKDFNLYALDTVNRKWVLKGKDEPIVIDKTPFIEEIFAETEKLAPTEPNIRIADREKQHFNLDIDPHEFPEMSSFNNVIFEVVDGDNTYKPHHAMIDWIDIKLNKRENGNYNITFYKTPTSSVSYEVFPVLSKQNYQRSLATFEEKMRTYEHMYASRITNQQALRDNYVLSQSLRDSLDTEIFERNEEIALYTKLIDSIHLAKHPIIDQANKLSDRLAELKKIQAKVKVERVLRIKKNEMDVCPFLPGDVKTSLASVVNTDLMSSKSLIEHSYKAYFKLEASIGTLYRMRGEMISSSTLSEDQNAQLKAISNDELVANTEFIRTNFNEYTEAKQHKQVDIMLAQSGASLKDAIYRSYKIDGFGIWNSDHPMPKGVGDEFILAHFKNEIGGHFSEHAIDITWIDKNINTVGDFKARNDGTSIKYSRDGNIVILAIKDNNKIYRYNNFDKIMGAKSADIVMEEVKGPFKSYRDLKEKLMTI